MPTEAEMAEVIRQIEVRQSSAYAHQGGDVIETIEGDLGWRDLSDLERKAILERNVTCRGFTPEQEQNVIDSLISGEPRERWMGGVPINSPAVPVAAGID